MLLPPGGRSVENDLDDHKNSCGNPAPHEDISAEADKPVKNRRKNMHRQILPSSMLLQRHCTGCLRKGEDIKLRYRYYKSISLQSGVFCTKFLLPWTNIPNKICRYKGQLKGLCETVSELIILKLFHRSA